MTIAKTGSSSSAAGNGATVAFPFAFRFFDDTDLNVYVVTDATGVSVLQTLTTDYTVSNTGTEAGGTVTMVTAPATGETLLIEREVPETQAVDYQNNDAFPAETHEGALDRLTLLVQQQSRGDGKHITFPTGDTASPTLPTSSSRAGKFFGFDSSGGILMYDSATILTASYDTRAQFVAAKLSLNNGSVVSADGLLYKYASGANSIPDLLGFLPFSNPTVRHFGGDTTVSDNAAEIELAINYCRTNGLTLDGEDLSFPITTAITAVPGKVRRMVIDASGLTATAAWQVTANAYEASKTLAADTLQNSRSFSVTGHSYSVGDVVLVTSDQVFESATSAQCAHWGKISRVIDADTFETHSPALCNLTTAQNAIVRRLPANAAAEVDVKITGGANCKNGFWPIRFTDLRVKMTGVNLAQRALTLQECYGVKVDEIDATDSDESGLGYGVNIAGCGQTYISFAKGLRCRHVITWGASGTIPCTGGTYGDVIDNESLGGVDTHAACLGITQLGTTYCSPSDELAAQDATVWQAVGGTVNVQFIDGESSRHGVLVQPFFDSAAFQDAPSYNITATGLDAADRGVIFDVDSCGAINTMKVHAEGKSVNEVVFFDIGPIAVEHIEISGNGTSTSAGATRVVCQATSNLAFVSQSGKWAGADEVIDILGPTDAGSRTIEWAVSLAKASGGTYGLRAQNKVDAIVGAAFMSGGTAATVATGVATVTVLT